jgi:hypothetical protein
LHEIKADTNPAKHVRRLASLPQSREAKVFVCCEVRGVSAHANVPVAREQWIASPGRHAACTRRATSGAAATLSHSEIPYRTGRNAALQPQSRQLLRPQQKQHIMQTLTCMLDCPPQTTMSPKRTLCSCIDTPPLVTTASLGLRDGGTNGSTTDHSPSAIDAFALYDPAWYPACACGQVSANAVQWVSA